jgi:hypothetical protein
MKCTSILVTNSLSTAVVSLGTSTCDWGFFSSTAACCSGCLPLLPLGEPLRRGATSWGSLLGRLGFGDAGAVTASITATRFFCTHKSEGTIVSSHTQAEHVSKTKTKRNQKRNENEDGSRSETKRGRRRREDCQPAPSCVCVRVHLLTEVIIR